MEHELFCTIVCLANREGILYRICDSDIGLRDYQQYYLPTFSEAHTYFMQHIHDNSAHDLEKMISSFEHQYIGNEYEYFVKLFGV